jgi:glutaconate CoA-transferase subunit B
MIDCNDMELMLVVASRHLSDNSVVIVGTGAPCAASMLAQRTHAPGMTILFEAGGIGPELTDLPISVGDSRTFNRGLCATSMDEIMSMLQRGDVDTAFIGGAQIDRYGNINSTQIGKDHAKPKIRFPGSGGANDLASLCWQSLCMTVHNPKRFVETVDFLTTPGYLTGPGAREKAGLPPGTGPYKTITNLCVMGFHPESKCMMVESIHPEVTRAQIIENTGFELCWADEVSETPAPTACELRVLREEVDPKAIITGRPVT